MGAVKRAAQGGEGVAHTSAAPWALCTVTRPSSVGYSDNGCIKARQQPQSTWSPVPVFCLCPTASSTQAPRLVKEEGKREGGTEE